MGKWEKKHVIIFFSFLFVVVTPFPPRTTNKHSMHLHMDFFVYRIISMESHWDGIVFYTNEETFVFNAFLRYYIVFGIYLS